MFLKLVPMRTVFCAAALLCQLGAVRAECADDMQKLIERRDALMNEIVPIPAPGEEMNLKSAACPKLQNLVAVLSETVSYFERSKQQCGIVDAVVDSVARQRDRVAAARAQLCPTAPKSRPAGKRAAH